MAALLLVLTAGLSFLSVAKAARACATESFQWTVMDARFDGADPSKGNASYATFAASVVPGTRGTFFECVASWPEAWNGWYQGGSNIIWSDCIWSGAGPTSDKTISFALDWKEKKMYFSHTFACSDKRGSDGMATGSITLNMDCAPLDGSTHCTPTNGTRFSISTKASPARLDTSADCAENTKRYQSWQIEKWSRQYERPAGSSGDPVTDTGPSFTLRNMANSDVFNCTPSPDTSGGFDGVCKTNATENAASSARFVFDPKLDMLTVTQSWKCGESSFDAVGIGYVQATCDRLGSKLICGADAVWVGTKTY